jgi:hypothetical protein
MFVSELRQVGRFLRVLRFPSNKTDRHDMTEILLKVALTITQYNQSHLYDLLYYIIFRITAAFECSKRSLSH